MSALLISCTVPCNFVLFFKGKNVATEKVVVPEGKELIDYKKHDLDNIASVEITGYDGEGKKVGTDEVSTTVYPEYFTVRNIHRFSPEKFFFKF